MSTAFSPAYFMDVSHYYHATVNGASGRNRPYYMPSDWYAAIGRKEVIYAAELAVRQLCEKVTWLNPKNVGDTHTLLTVH
jgi:hypothetical protein